MTSLKDYVTRMPSNQSEIYYLTGDSKDQILSSPFLETFKKNNIEVLILSEPIDEYCVSQLKEFESKKLVCISKEGVSCPSGSDEKPIDKAKYDPLVTCIKEILSEKVEKVYISKRLVKSPCVIVTGDHGWTANMEKIMKSQALRDSSMGLYMSSRKSLEINPS